MDLKEALEFAAAGESTDCISKSALAIRCLAKEINKLNEELEDVHIMLIKEQLC